MSDWIFFFLSVCGAAVSGGVCAWIGRSKHLASQIAQVDIVQRYNAQERTRLRELRESLTRTKRDYEAHIPHLHSMALIANGVEFECNCQTCTSWKENQDVHVSLKKQKHQS